MKTLLLLFSLYFFLCYGCNTQPTPEGLFMPVLVCLCFGLYSAINKDKKISIYFTKEQIEEMIEDES